MVATDVASRGIGMNKSQTPPLPFPPFPPSFLAAKSPFTRIEVA